MCARFTEQPGRHRLVSPIRDGLMTAEDKALLDSLVVGGGGVTSVSPPLTLVGGVADILPATTSTDGSMSAADKAKLDGIPAGGGGGAVTSVNTPLTLAAGVLDIDQASASLEGSMSAAHYTKLNALATINTVATPLTLGAGTLDIQQASASLEGSMSAADKAKLDALPAALGTPVTVPQGGTGATTLADRGLLRGNGTGAVTTVVGSVTEVLQTDASGVPFFGKLDLGFTNVNGTLPVVRGGTGASTAAGARTNLGLAIGTDVAAQTHAHAGADITSGTVATARLGSGTASSSTYLRGDQTWVAPPGGGGGEVNVLESVSGTAPIVVGAVSAKNQAISISAATTGAPGSLSAADFAKVQHLVETGSGPDFHVRAPGGQAFLGGKSHGYVLANAYYDGTNWQRYDTAQPAQALVVLAGAGLMHYAAPAGSNPITFVQTLFDPTVIPQLGATLSTYRATDLAVVASTPTTYASLALTQGKWQVEASVAVTQGGTAGLVDCYFDGIGSAGSVVLAAATKGVWHTATLFRVVGAGGETLNARTYSPVAHTVTALGGFAGFASSSGIRAVRVG